MPNKKDEPTFDELVKRIILRTNSAIKKQDAIKIVQAIMPQIDKLIEEKVSILCGNIDAMIANKVSEHFLLMGIYMSKKFKPHGD